MNDGTRIQVQDDDNQSGGHVSQVALRDALVEANAKVAELQRENEMLQEKVSDRSGRLTLAEQDHRCDVDMISTHLQTVLDHEEYDRVVEALNDHLYGNLTPREREYEVEAEVTCMTIVSVTATSENDAMSKVNLMDAGEIETRGERAGVSSVDVTEAVEK